jgi:hypothetical protein
MAAVHMVSQSVSQDSGERVLHIPLKSTPVKVRVRVKPPPTHLGVVDHAVKVLDVPHAVAPQLEGVGGEAHAVVADVKGALADVGVALGGGVWGGWLRVGWESGVRQQTRAAAGPARSERANQSAIQPQAVCF